LTGAPARSQNPGVPPRVTAAALQRACVALLAVLAWLAAAAPARADLNLPNTLAAENSMPATALELVVAHADARRERLTGISLSGEYAPVPAFSVKLALPFSVIDPRDAPTVAGLGDARLVLKYSPVMSEELQLVMGGGLRLGVPTGSERRGLGGAFVAEPFLVLGKAFGGFSVQADASFAWRLDRPRTLEPEEEGGPRVHPDRGQVAAANVCAVYALTDRVGLILEASTVTVIRGDETLRKRPQLYLTPGLGVEVVRGWSLRGGIQLPVTRARSFDYNALLILTRTF
jgi:hypothetical protein